MTRVQVGILTEKILKVFVNVLKSTSNLRGYVL